MPGCAKKPKSVYIPPEKKPTVEESRAYYIAELEKNGAQVIQVGEEIRVILRDDTTFIPDSANVRKEARPVLDWTAQLIKTYSKVDVKISGYLDNQGRGTYLAALSTRQAQVIANYLWDKGIDTRLLYAVGYNRLNPVDWNGTALGRSFNRRVEVSFRYYPHYESYE
ncbi:MAG: hypothetical protein A3F10_04720 [Coxiella sp. RIFCSPHIGHO2_12_FULL_42_15]|nr:MAG: hypothetical protein A3F10_04720 [Coxiella sp. RIFCSPHIGHO2_12_FULL_42_15]